MHDSRLSSLSSKSVIAILCTGELTGRAIAAQLRKYWIECLEVLAYSPALYYEVYLQYIAPDERVPLIFYFSRDEYALVQSCQDLLKVERRLDVGLN